MIHDSCFEFWVLECDVELKVESNNVLRFRVWYFFLVHTHFQLQCNSSACLLKAPQIMYWVLFTLCQSLHLVSVFMFSIYILHVTSCEPKKEIEDASQCCNNSISMVICVCIVGLTHFLRHCCNDIHVDLRADMHYEGLVHCEHEMLNWRCWRI